MRFLWGYGAVAALTLAVSVGLLDVPSRVLGHADVPSSPITLPAALAAPSAVVVAAPPPPPPPAPPPGPHPGHAKPKKAPRPEGACPRAQAGTGPDAHSHAGADPD